MSTNESAPSRNSATAFSFAALNTAGAAPPARPASTPSRRAGKSSSRTRSNVSGEAPRDRTVGSPVPRRAPDASARTARAAPSWARPSAPARCRPRTRRSSARCSAGGRRHRCVVRHAEQEVRLDHLERLVRQRGAVDGDLASHLPRGMSQRVGERRALQLLSAPVAERTSRRGEDESPHLRARPAR